MPAQPPIPTHSRTLQALTQVARLVLQIIAIGVRGLLFAGAHRRLPPSIRLRSPGFMACSAVFFVAAWLRHGLAGHELAWPVLLGAGLTFAALLVVSLAQRMAEFTLCLCISAAADLLATALSLSGLPMHGPIARNLMLAWPLAAVLVALVQLRVADLARTSAPLEWPAQD